MLFEVAPEASARRLVEALYAAEAGWPNAAQHLDEVSLVRLRSDATMLARLVPYALLCLAETLVDHQRPSVRLDTIRLLGMVHEQSPARVEAALRRLAADNARGVQRAAEMMLARLGAAA